MKVALYARVSSERQAEKDLSIPAQLKALRSHALKHGWEIVREFVDEAESARTANRPQFQEMIAYAKQKPSPLSAILVWKLSRFARNREDSIIYKALLRGRGVQVISINEQFDDSPTGKLLEGMIETMDEFYSANLGQDTRRGMKENAQRGFLNGAPVAFGYGDAFTEVNGVKKRFIVVNETEAPAVKRAFELCLQGDGAKDIAQTLNAEGFRTRQERRWNKPVILYMLRNEIYSGTYVWNRFNKSNGPKTANPQAEVIRIPNHHPALVELGSFDKVQRLLAQRAPKVTHPRVIASRHLLSGLVVCAHCGTRMVAGTAKSGRFVYYTCSRKSKEGKTGCSQKSLNAEKLEPCIVGVIRDRLLTEEHLSKLVRMVGEELQESETQSSTRLASLKTRLDDVGAKQRKYFDLIESDSISLADVAPRLKELSAAKEALLAERAKLEGLPRHSAAVIPSPVFVRAFVEELRETLQEGSITQQKAFLRSFIKRVGVRDNNAEIEYTCPIGLTGDRRREVLSIGKNGSRGRTRIHPMTGVSPFIHAGFVTFLSNPQIVLGAYVRECARHGKKAGRKVTGIRPTGGRGKMVSLITDSTPQIYFGRIRTFDLALLSSQD